MAAFRRTAMIAATLAAGATVMADGAGSLRLLPGRTAGGLVIANVGTAPLTIAQAIRVEQRTGATWHVAPTEMSAIASCPDSPDASPSGPVRLPAGARLSVVPWRGATCDNQCTTACRANVDFTPGWFRFGVTTLPDGAVHYGPVFYLRRR